MTGVRGFRLSLIVSQPATVNGLIGALDAGATPLKPATKLFWGYSGVVRAPGRDDLASLAKKDTGPATRQIDEIVLLLGARMGPRASGSTLTAASPWRRALAAGR
jgi:hypothetical protein